MVAFDEMLLFMMENPEETFTPARQRSKDPTAKLEKAAPSVLYDVS